MSIVEIIKKLMTGGVLNPLNTIGLMAGIAFSAWVLEYMLSSAGKSREAQMVGVAATISVIMPEVYLPH